MTTPNLLVQAYEKWLLEQRKRPVNILTLSDAPDLQTTLRAAARYLDTNTTDDPRLLALFKDTTPWTS